MGGLLSSSEAKNKSEKHFLHLTRRHGHECRVNVKYCKHEGTVKRHLTDLPWQKEKKHNLSPTLCANTSVHAAQDITIQLSDTVTEEIKQKLLGYLEHVEIMFVFSFLWTTATQSLHYSATATPGARLHTSITEVTILPLAAVGSTAALICIWIF